MAFGRARLEIPSLVRRLWAQSEEEEEVEERRMRDGHCWHIAAVEEVVVHLTHGGQAMAGKVEEGMSVEQESQGSQDLVEEKKIGLISVSEAR